MKVVLLASLAYVALVAVLARRKLPELHPRRFFLETWQSVDREAREARARREAEGRGYDWRPIVAYLGAAVILTFQEYFERMTGDPVRWGHPLAALLGALDAQLDFGIAAIGGTVHLDGTTGMHARIHIPLDATGR